jgi:hypothetical protein
MPLNLEFGNHQEVKIHNLKSREVDLKNQKNPTNLVTNLISKLLKVGGIAKKVTTKILSVGMKVIRTNLH